MRRAKVGELTVREIPEVGVLTFQYLADPEGNIIEVQRWSDSSPAGAGAARPGMDT